MITTLSSKGQVVLPKNVRNRLRLASGAKLSCKVQGRNVILIPQDEGTSRSKSVKDPETGLIITVRTGDIPKVTSEQVHAALVDFP